jgi:hypothetical protein
VSHEPIQVPDKPWERGPRRHRITHPWPYRLLWLWRILCCRIGWHLFDEVWSSADDEQSLSCDACELLVYRGRIEDWSEWRP